MENKGLKQKSLSIVIPVLNGQNWIRETILNVMKCVDVSEWDLLEVVCVDDGSTDQTSEVIKNLAASDEFRKLKLIVQENKGRYLARKVGVDRARGEFILLIDSRVRIEMQSLPKAYLLVDKYDCLCAHIEYARESKIYGFFWSAAETIFWNKYWKKPEEVQLNQKNFNNVPKGTTCLLSKKSLLEQAFAMFTTRVVSIKNASDDTELIRIMSEIGSVAISPSYSAVYFPRVNFKDTMRHAFFRGVFFVDGHMFQKSKLRNRLLSIITLIICILILLVKLRSLPSGFVLTITFLNLYSIIKYRKLRWKRILSLNMFMIPFFLSWALGVFRGLKGKRK